MLKTVIDAKNELVRYADTLGLPFNDRSRIESLAHNIAKAADGERDRPEFPMGLKWSGNGPKKDRIYCLVDYLVTRNMAGDVVRIRYAASYGFAGRFMVDDDVVPTTIKRAIADGRVLNPELIA